eukprot:7866204-Pyramimonas_sp.AAC.1
MLEPGSGAEIFSPCVCSSCPMCPSYPYLSLPPLSPSLSTRVLLVALWRPNYQLQFAGARTRPEALSSSWVQPRDNRSNVAPGLLSAAVARLFICHAYIVHSIEYTYTCSYDRYVYIHAYFTWAGMRARRWHCAVPLDWDNNVDVDDRRGRG